MKLTKEEAIHRHRMMWDYIAKEGLKRKKCISREDAFKHFGWDKTNYGVNWCCAYDDQYNENLDKNKFCSRCPIVWPSKCGQGYCTSLTNDLDNDGILAKWVNSFNNNDYRGASYYALLISMLPENPNT